MTINIVITKLKQIKEIDLTDSTIKENYKELNLSTKKIDQAETQNLVKKIITITLGGAIPSAFVLGALALLGISAIAAAIALPILFAAAFSPVPAAIACSLVIALLFCLLLGLIGIIATAVIISLSIIAYENLIKTSLSRIAEGEFEVKKNELSNAIRQIGKSKDEDLEVQQLVNLISLLTEEDFKRFASDLSLTDLQQLKKLNPDLFEKAISFLDKIDDKRICIEEIAKANEESASLEGNESLKKSLREKFSYFIAFVRELTIENYMKAKKHWK